MNIQQWYIAFHPPARRPLLRIFGHVEIFGHNGDNTWVFIDPQRAGSKIEVLHRHDDVERALLERFCSLEVWGYEPGQPRRLPLHLTVNCATICSYHIGLRAYSPASLRRILRKNGARKITDGSQQTQGERREPQGAGA